MPQGGSIKKAKGSELAKKRRNGPGKPHTKSKHCPQKRKLKTVLERCSQQWEKEHMNGLHCTVTSKAKNSNTSLKVLKSAHQPVAKKSGPAKNQ